MAPPVKVGNDHQLALDPSRMRLFASGGKAYSFPTDGTVFNIGREPGNDLVLMNNVVSRHHAFGCWQDGQLYISDRSSGGTYINGVRAPKGEWTPVPEGATLDLGNRECRLTMGVGGSHTVMHRLDQLMPVADKHQLRLADGSVVAMPTFGKLLKVGRSLDAEIPMQEGSVSRYHADVKYDNGKLLVRDHGSTCGTLVNGKRVQSHEWVAVPEGGRVQFGHNPGSSMMVEAKAPMLITFFGDSSTPDIGGHVEAQVGGFERALSNHNSPAVVRGVMARGSILKDVGLTALPALLGAEGVAGLGAAGWGLAMLAGGSAAAGLGLVGAGLAVAAFGAWGVKQTLPMMRNGLKKIKDRLSGMSLKPGSWSHVQQAVISRGPSLGQFKHLYAENMERYPASRHVVFLSGHGNQKGAAGLNYADVGQVVKGADAIFLDACNGAQLESLAQLSGSARVVVASEHTVAGRGFPLDRMFGRGNFPEQPRDLGAALVQAASREMPSESLVAVDVKVMKEELFPALNELGKWMKVATDRGWGGRIREAMDASIQPSNGIGGIGKKVDLGSFLHKLGEIPELRCPEQLRAQHAFDRTILSMSGNGTVSFDARGSKSLPEAFNAFLKGV